MCPNCGQPFGGGQRCQHCGAPAPAGPAATRGRGWAFGALGLIVALVAGLVIWRVSDPPSTGGSAVAGTAQQTPPTDPTTDTDTSSTDTTDTDTSSTETTDSSSTETGSTDTDSIDTDPTDTGSTSTGSTSAGSTSTGSTSTGSTSTGSTSTGSTSTGSTSTGSTSTGSTGSGDLVVGLASLPTDADPAVGSTGSEAVLWRQVFDTLTGYRGTSIAAQPGLAASWVASADAREWTFIIAADRKFHDGTPVTAAAVCANFQFWYTATGTRAGDLFDWNYFFGGVKGQPATVYRSCTASGASAVMTFSRPMPALPDIVSATSFGIHSPASLTGRTPVGSGSYRWVSGDTQTVQLAGFGPDMQGRKLSFRTIGDPAAAAAAVRNGEIGLYYNPGPDPGPDTDGVSVEPNYADRVVTLHLHADHGVLADKNVREAVFTAIDRKTVNRPIGAEPARSVLPGLYGGPALSIPATDPVKAKKLLQGKKITLTMAVRQFGSGAAANLQVGQLVQAQLAEAGITVKLQAITSVNDYYDKTATPTIDLSIDPALAYIADLGDYIGNYLPGAQYHVVVPKASVSAFDAAIEKAVQAPDYAERQLAGVDVLQELVADREALPMYSYGGQWFVGSRVAGFKPVVFNQVRLDSISVR